MTDTTDSAPVAKAATPTSGESSGGILTERGVSGLRHWGGYIYEEDDPRLRGLNGIKFFRQLSRYPTCAAIRFALEALMRRSVWRVEASGKSTAHDDAAEFMTGVLFEDMAHPWEDFVADSCSMFPYGFAPFEIVFKKRSGIPKGADPTKGSRFDDGKIGLKRIALRSQDTLSRWAFDELNKDELLGMYQLDPVKGGELFIPAERLVLIRTTPARTNPEGESIFRGAVRPYQQVLEIELAEGSMATRAAGVVVVDIPEEAYKDPLARAAWEGIGRNLADNREGFVLLPTVIDKEKKAVPAYNIRYVVADGRRSGDMGPIITRKQREILMTVLADWIMLGHTAVGTQALSSDKSGIFMTALGGYLGVILAAVNREIIPAVWAANGLPWDLMPQARAEPLEKSDLGVIGSFVSALSGAGMPLFPDDELENSLRALAKLPAKPEEGIPILGAPPADPRRGGRQPLPQKDQKQGQDQQPGGQGREGETDAAARRQQEDDDDEEDPAGGRVRKAAAGPALGFGRRMAAVAKGVDPQDTDRGEAARGGPFSPAGDGALGKAWNPSQPRDGRGRFSSAPGAAESVDERITRFDAEAKDHVLSLGRQTGHEHIAAFDRDTGEAFRVSGTESNFVGFTEDLLTAVRDPQRRIVAHHNHPFGASLSQPDVAMLVDNPGLAVVHAHAHEGSSYRAERTELTGALSVDGFRRVHHAVLMAHRDALSAVPQPDAHRLVTHGTNSALGRLGVIRYDADLSTGMAGLAETHREVLGTAGAEAEKRGRVVMDGLGAKLRKTDDGRPWPGFIDPPGPSAPTEEIEAAMERFRPMADQHPDFAAIVEELEAALDQQSELQKAAKRNQPRDHLGRYAPVGASIRSAAPNVAAINDALGLDLEPGGSFFRRGTHDKILGKRPEEFAYTMTHLNKALRKPDFVGRHPDHPERVQLVKLTPGKDFNALLVSIDERRGPGGDYRIATAHSLKQGQVDERVRKGWLHATKKARR